VVAVSDTDFVAHLHAARFLAQRARFAATVTVIPPDSYALPGALTPISADRIVAHQEDGLAMHEIVGYENEKWLDAHAGRREKHRAWVARDYDAMVQVERELRAERHAKEARASAEYRQKLAAILARKDAGED
jgi:hypothetical protein